jgi:phenylalanyl-tRNA synthetase beta chain
VRVTLEWLREWVDFDVDAETLAEQLTTAGLEVDAVLPVAGRTSGVVVAEIVEVAAHPDVPHLSVCTVDAGGLGRFSVVCGAPNVTVGARVPFAPIGASLGDERQIGRAQIRGVSSEGMLCSAAELGLSDEADGLFVLDASATPGTPLEAHLRLADVILDVDLTPNRGDCFSILGIAREIAAKQAKNLTGPRADAVPVTSQALFEVELSDDRACPRFVGRVVRNIAAGSRSPDWMRERLRRVGLRPIHPVVDVTNYVMIELGQPLHAYNLAKLTDHIVVRMAAKSERLTLLDGNDVELEPDALVIADASGPIGLAGIMGGASTAVSAETVDVFLEAAFFSPEAILGRARRYGLQTDASQRFERGVDPTGQERAIERATELLIAIAGGEAGPVTVVESRGRIHDRQPVGLRHHRVESVLGTSVAHGEIERWLERLGMKTTHDGEGWSVVPPAFRFDIAIEEDLIEEVGRMMGYDAIPAVPGSGSASLGDATEHRVALEYLADLLAARGYCEVITYSFIDPTAQQAVEPDASCVRLANPISREMGVMRGSLWPGLLSSAQQNLSRQRDRVRIFEIGRRFDGDAGNTNEYNVVAGLACGGQWPDHWDESARDVDFYDIKGDIEALLSKTGRTDALTFEPAMHPALMPGKTARIRIHSAPVGWLGAVHPKVQRHFDLKKPAVLFELGIAEAFEADVPSYRPYSKFPSVRRDLAFVVDETVSADMLRAHAKAAAGELLRSVEVFDVYRGEGIDSSRKSIALGLILQGASRTLTDEDADQTVQSVRERLEHELGATIRT